MKSMRKNINTILTSTLEVCTFIPGSGSNGATSRSFSESPLFEGFRTTNRDGQDPTQMAKMVTKNITLQVTNITAVSNQEMLLQGIGTTSMDFFLLSRKEMRVRRTMKKVSTKWMHSAIVAILSVSAIYAQGTPKLDLKMDEQKVNRTAAEMRDGSTITYLPGDTLRYTIVASNVGDGLMTEPEVVDPIPAGVTYIANSAEGENAAITFSIDQGRTYMAWPPTYTVRNAQGEVIQREAGPEMVTHIKWSIQSNLNPGDASNLEFMVEVSK